MLGSPNGVREIYDTSDVATADGRRGRRRSCCAEALTDAGPRVGGGGHRRRRATTCPFDQVGIPIGGLFSGASEVKTEAQAGSFGGTAGAPEDACYHLACDTAANIDRALLEQLARAAAWTFGTLADGEVDAAGGLSDRTERVVGVAGFEPTTSSSRTMRATRLRYTPTGRPLTGPADDTRDRPGSRAQSLARAGCAWRGGSWTGHMTTAAATKDAAISPKTIGRPVGSPSGLDDRAVEGRPHRADAEGER